MGVIASRFEESNVWENARLLSRDVYIVTKVWRDFELKDQIRRAVVSISSNIAKGYDRGSKADFARFLYIARGSASEVRSQLYLALDLDYLSKDQFDALYGKIDRIVRQLASFIAKLK